jgi:rhodanese-related sulfurtransferase
MSTPLYAVDEAAAALAAARPQLVDVVPAASVVPHLADGGACHAGPPIASTAMCGPMRAALGVALAMEGVAEDAEAALVLADAGEVTLRPNHDCGGVGPMSGVVTGSMPVMIAHDEATDAVAWCPLNEGSGKVLRYGANDDEVVARLAWMRDVLAPDLARALAARGPLELIDLHSASLLRGDEAHHRTEAGTELIADALAPLDADVDTFIRGNGQFFLNVAMVFAKLALVCASGVRGSALVTAVARNGVEVGVKLSGTGDAWFTGPAAAPDPAALYPGFTPEEMQNDLGDSAIIEVYGLGALAISASPLSAPSVGLDVASIPERMALFRRIAGGENPALSLPDGPAILGVDARKVVSEGIVPPIHTGIAHREPGVGQIGGGVTLPPLQAFTAAVAALDG